MPQARGRTQPAEASCRAGQESAEPTVETGPASMLSGRLICLPCRIAYHGLLPLFKLLLLAICQASHFFHWHSFLEL